MARRAFEDVRHGTQTLIANWDVEQGRVHAPSLGTTRTEVDVAAHIERALATDQDAEWILVTDQLPPTGPSP